MGAAIGVYLLVGAVKRNPFRKDDAGYCLGALIVDGDRLGPACEPIDHRENRIVTGAGGERALTADDFDVQRRKRLVGGQASGGGARIWIRVLVTITN